MGVFRRRGDAASKSRGRVRGRTRGSTAVGAYNGSNAAGRDIVDSVALHIEQAVLLTPKAHAAAADVPAPMMLRNIPRLGELVGRRNALEQLDAAFATSGDVVIQAVHGLGGIGKSALAAHWAAHRFTGNPRWWITADSRTAVDAGLAELGRALPQDRTDLSEELRIEWAVQWLAAHEDWLVVLDNVEHLDDIRFLLDRVTTGRFLITTRRATGWTGHAATLRLDVLGQDEAVALFTRILPASRAGAPQAVATLCAELGCLPLAVEQAASYCAETGTSPRDYLRMLTETPAEMFASTAEDGDPERTIARIWRITLDRLTDTPLAGDILRILAWCAPRDIPRTLLDDLAPAPVLARAIGRLIAHSMITDGGDGTLFVHRLVQALARTPDADDPHRTPDLIDKARRAASTALRAALPATSQDPATWPTWRALTPHIDALHNHASSAPDNGDTASVLNEAGLFHLHQGDTGRAITYYERALALNERDRGETDPDTLTVRNNLARAYEHQGDVARAIALLENTLRDRERVLGADDPATLSTRNNLAMAYQSAGDVDRALPLYERTLRDRLRTVGPDHQDTLIARNNLAFAYQAAGDPARALPLHLEIARDAVRILGRNHLHTLIMRNNVADAYAAMGDAVHAISHYREVLRDREAQLGADHPHTLATCGGLAHVHASAGDLRRAIALFERTLTGRERVLGADSRLTLATRRDLAHAYAAAGDLKRAVPLLERVLQDETGTVGEHHPDTVTARLNLATAYVAAGDPARALPVFQRALDDAVRLFGAEHPETTAIRAAYAVARRHRTRWKWHARPIGRRGT
ncbi:tetratricopeptide repeat protein [Streptomyces roseolilacinus]|uniref:tetratricopeptide repeat protein n=1 Tax=Streptomyces roseolilacinus TaxID=66904 RepID=UPI0038263E92